MGRHIPNKLVTFDDREAPWITNQVRTSIKINHRVYRKWVSNGTKPEDYEYVKLVRKETEIKITNAKIRHMEDLSSKLCDPNTGQKEFWGAYNRILN